MNALTAMFVCEKGMLFFRSRLDCLMFCPQKKRILSHQLPHRPPITWTQFPSTFTGHAWGPPLPSTPQNFRDPSHLINNCLHLILIVSPHSLHPIYGVPHVLHQAFLVYHSLPSCLSVWVWVLTPFCFLDYLGYTCLLRPLTLLTSTTIFDVIWTVVTLNCLINSTRFYIRLPIRSVTHSTTHGVWKGCL